MFVLKHIYILGAKMDDTHSLGDRLHIIWEYSLHCNKQNAFQ